MRHDEMPSLAAERALAGQDMLPLRGRADDRAPEVARLQANVIAGVESWV